MGDAARFEKMLAVVLNPDAPRQEINNGYTVWSEHYREDVVLPSVLYEGPKNVALQVQKLYLNRKDIYILDIAAGTGLVGENLKAFGYTNVDALDANEGMLSQAKKRNIYQKYIVDNLGPNKLDIHDNTYDVITSSAAMYKTHFSGDAFPELIRITKPGGHIIILTGEDDEFAGNEIHHPFIAEVDQQAAALEAAGKWTKIVRSTEPASFFFEGSRGALFVYQVL